MPSAAKKRKAAKKKKEMEANLDLPINDSLGNDDVKNQEETVVCSPLFLDGHNHQTPLNGVEKSDQPPFLEDETVVIIENESKCEEDFPRKIMSINHIDSAKESNDNVSSSSKSSSSEEESQVTESKSADHNMVLKTNTYDDDDELDNSSAPIDEKHNLLGRIEAMVDSSSTVDSAVEKTICIEEVKPCSSVEEFAITENGRKDLPSSNLPINETSDGVVEHTRNYEIPQVTESQPVVASAPGIAQKTSFLSCCGLFDAFTGSNR